MSGFKEYVGKILCLMLENSKITLDEIAEVIGVNRRTIERQVKKLKDAKIINRVGSNKSGFWQVILDFK